MKVQLKDYKNETRTLEDFQGKFLVLDFWASWCIPCKNASPIIDNLHKNSNPEKFKFLGINTDDSLSNEEIERTALEFGMSYESYLDPELKLSNSLQIEGIPALLFFDPKGFLLHRQYGIKSSDYYNLQKMMSEWTD
jgi:thiol-disulfide isomerase/thioredoxin